MDKMRNLNERIAQKASDKLTAALDKKEWDAEAFDVMCRCLHNIKILNHMDSTPIHQSFQSTPSHHHHHSMPEPMPRFEAPALVLPQKKVNPYTDTTEFEQLIYDINERTHGSEKSMIKVTEIVAEHMEDMRILNNKAYQIVMNKLKGIKK